MAELGNIEGALLLNLMKTITREKDYCVVCLRTGVERRLVEPIYLKKLMATLNQLYVFEKKFQLVCYICERQAEAAFKFRKVLSTAVQANHLVQQLLGSRKLKSIYNDIKLEKDFVKLIIKHKPAVMETYLDCSLKLRRHRKRSKFHQTEVLIVSSPEPPVSTSIPDNCVYLIDDDTNGQEEIVPKDQEKESEKFSLSDTSGIAQDPLIIYEDDEQPVDITKSQTETTIGPSGGLCDPIGPSGGLCSIPYIQDPDQNNRTNIVLHPIFLDRGLLTVPSLSANICNGYLLASNGNGSIISTPQIALQKGENIDIISNPNEVTAVLTKFSQNDANKVHINANGMSEIKSENNSSESNLTISSKPYQIVSTQTNQTNSTQCTLINSTQTNHTNSTQSNRTDNKQSTVINSTQTNQTISSQSYQVDINSKLKSLLQSNPPNNKKRGKYETRKYVKISKNNSELPIYILPDAPQQVEPSSGLTLAVSEPFTLGDTISEHASLAMSEPFSIEDSSLTGRTAQQRSDKIDWEDKIPMDVISFVDDKKQCNRSNNMPALSNVRSLDNNIISLL